MKEAMKKWLHKYQTDFSTDAVHSLCNSLGLDGEKVDGCLALCYQLEKGDIDNGEFTVGLGLLTGKKPEEVAEVLRGMKAESPTEAEERELILEEEYHAMPIELNKEIVLYKATKVKPADTEVQLLGRGTYVSPSYEGAAFWGKDVVEVKAKIRKALLIGPEETVSQSLTREGLYPPEELMLDGLNDWLIDQGYDAIIHRSVFRGHDHINIINRNAIIEYGVQVG